MKFNTQKLTDTLEYVREHPEEHNQGSWGKRTDCGTTFCIAGHLIDREEGWTPIYLHNGNVEEFFGPDGNEYLVSSAAALILGIPIDEDTRRPDEDDSDLLFGNVFHPELTLDDIEMGIKFLDKHYNG